MATVKKNNTKVAKREASTLKYIDTLQDVNSKLCVIRLDLAYKKPYSNDISVDEANKDFKRMLNNSRSNSIFDDMVGYVCKREYTQDKGVHFHTLFFYNGQKVKNDKHKGDELGQYWTERITEGRGSMYNCNRNTYKERGIGMLNYDDTKKREYLNKSLSYLCKDDENQAIGESGVRELIRGTMPKGKIKSGRPRKNEE